MNIEKEIFKRSLVDFKKLEDYGFLKENNVYKYSKVFMDNFQVDIKVDEQGIVSGKIYDLTINDEYVSFRIESQVGEFVNRIRKEYQNILEDIRKNCFQKLYFITDQANRITNFIMNTYHDEPEFVWDKFPGYGIFRNPNNEKWYGLIMNLDKSKIDKTSSGEVEVINVKLDEKEIPILLNKKGFYPSYHMNKKSWITIILDDTLSDDEIMKYIKISHSYTEVVNEWIIPANPKYYDIEDAINSSYDNTFMWKQSNNIKIGDLVYLYIASPISAIKYKCVVEEVNIPYNYCDENIRMSKVMKLRLLKRYNKIAIDIKMLNEYGVKTVRGPRNMPSDLKNKIESLYNK